MNDDDNEFDNDDISWVEELFSEMLSRIQGFEGKQVSEEVMKSVTDAVLELVRTLREVCDNNGNEW